MKIKRCNSSPGDSEYRKAKKAMEEKIIAPDYLYVYNSKSKGRGIKTKKTFRKGEYILFYSGKIASTISSKENYYFQISAGKTPKYIDCSEDDGSYGRLLNDNHFNPNLKVVPVRNADGDLIPVFFALRDISVDEPLEYDYGGPSLLYPWRNKRSSPMDTKKPSRKRLKEEEELGSKKAKCSVAADLERPETLADHEPYLCWIELPNQEEKVSVSNIKGDLEENIEDILDNLTATCEKLKEVSEMQDSTNIQVNSLSAAMTERIRDLSDLQQDTTLQISSFSGVADERLKEVAEIQKATSLQMESLSLSMNERFKEVSDIQKGTSLQISSLSSSVKKRLGEISGMQGISSTQIASLSSATNERFNEVSNIQRETLLQMESSSKSVSEQFKEVSGIQKSSSLQLGSLSSSTKEILNEVSKIQETSAQQISSLSSAIKDQVEEVSLVHKNLTQNVEGIVASTDETINLMSSSMNENFSKNFAFQDKTNQQIDKLSHLTFEHLRKGLDAQETFTSKMNQLSLSTDEKFRNVAEVQQTTGLQLCSTSEQLKEVLEIQKVTMLQMASLSNSTNEKFCALSKNIESLIEEASENRRFMTKAFTVLSQRNQNSETYTRLAERLIYSTSKQESLECGLSGGRSRPFELAAMETEPRADKPSSSSSRAALGSSSAEETGAGGGSPPLSPHDAAAASDRCRTSRTDAGGESPSVQAPDEGGGGGCLEESPLLEKCGQPSSDSEEPPQGGVAPSPGGWGRRSCLLDEPPAAKEEEQSVADTFMRPNRADGEGKSTQDSSLDGGSQQTKVRVSTRRPCLFCKKKVTWLKRHLTNVHKEENEIKEIITLSPSNQRLQFELLRKKGIHIYNTEILKKSTSSYQIDSLQCEKKSKSRDMKICPICHGYFCTKYLTIHLKRCKLKHSSSDCVLSPLEVSSADIRKLIEEKDVSLIRFSPRFVKTILEKFRDNDIGNFCRRDPLIRYVGFYIFTKGFEKYDDPRNWKAQSVKKDVMNKMRFLSKFILNMRKICGRDITLQEVYNQSLMTEFKKAVKQTVNCKSDNHYGYLFVHVGKILQIRLGWFKKENERITIEKFVTDLKKPINWVPLFGK